MGRIQFGSSSFPPRPEVVKTHSFCVENIYIMDEKVFQLEMVGERGKDNVVVLQLSVGAGIEDINPPGFKLTDP